MHHIIFKRIQKNKIDSYICYLNGQQILNEPTLSALNYKLQELIHKLRFESGRLKHKERVLNQNPKPDTVIEFNGTKAKKDLEIS